MPFSISGRTIELMEKNSKVEARGRRRRQSPARWQGCMYEQFMVVYNGIVCMRTSLIFWACSMLRVTIGLAFFLNLRKMMIGGDVVGFKFNGCFHPLRRYILFRPPWWAFHVSGSRRKQKQQKRSPRFVLVPFINNLPHNCHYKDCNEGVNFDCWL